MCDLKVLILTILGLKPTASSSCLAKDLSEKDIEKAVEQVLASNKQAIADLKSGNAKTMNFLVGQVMRLTKAKAEPRQVQKIIEKKTR